MLQFDHAWRTPGQTDALENVEGQVWWGGYVHQPLLLPVFLDGAARDAGNSPNTILRPGLLMGIVRATGKWKEWTPGANDGSENIAGVMLYEAQTQAAGVNADRWFGYCMVAGNLKTAALIIPGESTAGIAGKALEFVVRQQLTSTGRFVLDDDLTGLVGRWARIKAKTSNYTIQASDYGTLFTNEGATGAVTFTLPVAREGFRVGFYVVENQDVVIAANPADTLVVFNDNAADSVSLSTASEKIGGYFEVVQTATKSLVIPHLWEGQTPTIAT